ncbi:MAG: patatin-like phospholipase family protein [Bacteroidota bacterium]|nr:patatin-like phospholipase family protein [Bacteroidota bacterium]
MLRISLLFIFLAFSLFPQLLLAQSDSGERPKIGYVLSGGGAKGMAHVGVLKVLEEVGLEPDYITGTSMGSIMGGLYSIDYSAEEISHIIETVDWSQVLTNEIPANQVLMRRKKDYSKFMMEMPVYNGKPELPSGLIEGQKLSELFSNFTWRQAGVNDFNDFPTPFACIGTDILKGGKVEMNSGDLSSAMRASMAIPSVFTPVIRDSTHILVDGGVVRNFPVQEVIDMGADIVIGVYVGFDSQMKPEQLRSLTSIMTRTSLLSGAEDVQSQVPLVDYMIVPDLSGYSPASFTSGVEIMERGEVAAREQIDRLRALADSVNALGPPREKHSMPSHDSILIREITILDASSAMTSFVIATTGLEADNWISKEQLEEGMDKLFGTLFFDRIDYYFEALEEGYRLVFRIQEKPNGAIKFALHYDNDFGPGVILNYTLLNSLVEGSRLSITGDISKSPQIKGYYDIHLGRKRKTIASLMSSAARASLPMFNENEVDIGDYKRTFFEGGLNFSQILKLNSQLDASFYYHYSSLKISKTIKEFEPDLEYLDNIVFRGPQLSLGFQHNSFDNLVVPTKGTRIELKYRQSLGTDFISNFDFPDSLDLENSYEEYMDPYWVVTAAWESYFALGKKLSLNFDFSVGVSANDKPFTDNFYVGGYRYNLRENQVAFVGLNSNELLQGNYVKEKIALQYEVIPNLYISALGNLILVADDNQEFLDNILEFSSEGRYIGAGAGAVYKTPIGPVSIFLGSRTDAWNPIWYINIGYTF